ncbi:hypothetical protein FE633_23390 [Streptomyces montanus]|uniref:UL36 very large tegument protein n=1 Tax=Streptomyces montanus TaxID=2580423 RepID=A0A5R9FKE4_9ACTN|nr:hypothetical protein [Streptomyces montanus]TLS43751.1 hypothetical protein FE633_23390 [Streptomyces montanus]
MAVEQLPGQVREFAQYLNGLLTRLDQGGGWCGVFWQRDPDGMRACLDGVEIPPWDVVEALLQDVAARYGDRAAAQEAERARALHAASLAAYDARPGGRDALDDRLDVMLREQRYAAERLEELGRLLRNARSAEEAEPLRLDLAWARDDHERATARCAELRARMAQVDRRAASEYGWKQTTPDFPQRTAPDGLAPAAGARPEAHPASPAPDPAPKPAKATKDAKVGKQRSKRRPRGGARFAGIVEEDVDLGAVPAMPAPALPVTDAGPRGARFAGVAEEVQQRPTVRRASSADEARRATVETVERLVRLRQEGRSGEAHAILAEAAYWPADRFPVLASELQRAGLGADWATLLWEALSLPVGRLVAAADALVAAGRTADGQQMLRQGVVRPASEIGEALLELVEEGRGREVRAVLDAYVRVRTPEEAARSADAAPQRLTPLLLEAAHGISDDCHRNLVHALRVAGYTT